MPCPCCGARLKGEPTKAETAKSQNEENRLRRYVHDYSLAMGLRAEGAAEKEIGKIRGLYAGMGLGGRRRLRGLWGSEYNYAPGMVQRWGKGIVVT
jgi:hypothetical protein